MPPFCQYEKGGFFMAKAKEARKRNWVFIVYPDSAPSGWMEILRAELVPAFVSPLHDADHNADDSEKKPHWHVMLMFHSLHSYEQVLEITSKLNATRPQGCKDLRAYARYLCHLDNPEKAQYSPNDVVCMAGADYLEKIQSAADTDSALSAMMDWCIDNECYSFYRLVNYARTYQTDWFRVLTNSKTVFMVHWLKSMQWEVQNGNRLD